MAQAARQHITRTVLERQTSSLHETLSRLVTAYGLTYFAAAAFPEFDRAGLNENLLATNWPDGLLAMYKGTNMYLDSRVVTDLRKSTMPVLDEALLFARACDTSANCELSGPYCDDDFANTLGLSLHDADRRHYLLMISGRRKITGKDELGRLVLDAMRAIDELAATRTDAVKLSDRELNCLRWAGAGKSTEEIAVILSLSPYTVNDYLRASMRKLDAVSRTQAVARAYRLKLI